MHLAESMIEFPEHIIKKITPPKWFARKYPQDKWEWDVGPYSDFAKLEPLCRELGIMKTTIVGRAELKLLKLRELIELHAEALQENPDMFYTSAGQNRCAA